MAEDPNAAAAAAATAAAASAVAVGPVTETPPAKRRAVTAGVRAHWVAKIRAREVSQADVARKLGVTTAAVSTWVKNGDVWSKMDPEQQKRQPVQFPDIEKKIMAFIVFRQKQLAKEKPATSWRALQSQAEFFRDALIATGRKEYESFNASTGWLQKMFKRNNLIGVRLSGEGPAMDDATVDKELEPVRAALDGFELDDIYSANETTIFYSQLPHFMFSSDALKQDLRSTVDMAARDRAALMLCANATGSLKLPLLLLSSIANPPCFSVRPCPTAYAAQTHAILDRDRCQQWFERVFVPHVRTHNRGRKVALVWDSNPCHAITNTAPEYVHLVVMPTAISAHFQPMDQGILIAVKLRYKLALLAKLDSVLDAWDEIRAADDGIPADLAGLSYGHKPHLLDVAETLKAIWEHDVPAEAVAGCFARSKCLSAQKVIDLQTALAQAQAHAAASEQLAMVGVLSAGDGAAAAAAAAPAATAADVPAPAAPAAPAAAGGEVEHTAMLPLPVWVTEAAAAYGGGEGADAEGGAGGEEDEVRRMVGVFERLRYKLAARARAGGSEETLPPVIRNTSLVDSQAKTYGELCDVLRNWAYLDESSAVANMLYEDLIAVLPARPEHWDPEHEQHLLLPASVEALEAAAARLSDGMHPGRDDVGHALDVVRGSLEGTQAPAELLQRLQDVEEFVRARRRSTSATP